MRKKNMKTDTDCGMTPAAFLALACGDEMNYLAAALPGEIERQEKQGQLKQATLQTLPKDGMEKYRPHLESVGFKIGKVVDHLFVNVQFPEGWQKKPTDHSMWSDLVDSKGRRRGSIFYKAAFYDQKAHFDLNRRYSIRMYEDGSTPDTYKVTAHDQDQEIQFFGEYPRRDYKAGEVLEAKVKEWLTEQFPGWDSEDAYKMFWD